LKYRSLYVLIGAPHAKVVIYPMSSFKTNLKHQVKQTPLPKWKPLIPLFEAVMNSIQSIKEAGARTSGNIIVDVHREGGLFVEDDPPVEGFTITDDGVGLTDENFDSFNTSFSDYKEERWSHFLTQPAKVDSRCRG
jgi:hypothetical protein